MNTRTLALGLLVALAPATAAAKHLVHTTTHGLALDGYDPVSFLDEKSAKPGRFEFEATYAGAKYRFATKANLKAFQKNPKRYVPQYGGFCAYAASKGRLAPTDIETWSVIDGKLYLNKSPRVARLFKKEGPKNVIARSDAVWPKLLATRGTNLTAAQVTRRRDLSLAAAKTLIEAGWAYARANGAPGGSIAVVDSGGHVLYLVRADGTFGAAARVSIEKARTAALFRFPSKNLEDAIIGGRGSLVTVGHNMLRGGLPIFFDGEVIGGIGVSGAASADQDVAIAQAALRTTFEASER
ncbi:MAG: YHS domain-containing (seleno)protein [Myxococcota bacterium]